MSDNILHALLSSVEAHRPVALATVTAAPDPSVIGRHAVVWLDAEPQGELGLGELEAQALAVDRPGRRVSDQPAAPGLAGQIRPVGGGLSGPQPANACHLASSLNASKPVPRRSSLHSSARTACPVLIRNACSRWATQSWAWFSRWSPSDKMWVNHTVIVQPKLNSVEI